MQHGRTIEFAERDYRFGVGSLRLRVERVDATERVQYDGEDWVMVEGVEIGANGSERGHRRVLVRAERLLNT
jgi:hypothetical protein